MSGSLDALEARLRSLGRQIVARFPERAEELAALVEEPEEGAQREGIRRAAHRLKGIAGSVGEAGLGAEAGLLEGDSATLPREQLRARALALAARLRAVAEARLGLADPSSTQAPEGEGPQASPVARVAAPRPLGRVVVVDDDDASRRLLELTFGRMGGASVRALASGEDALAALEASEPEGEAPSLVVLDGRLPGLDGRAMWKRLRSLEGTRGQVPILMLSAATREELGWEEVQGARTLWLAKPFRPSVLLESVRTFLDSLDKNVDRSV